MSEPFFIIRNKHGKGCGEPPHITNDEPNVYYGYFENDYGEQWVFTYHRKSKVGELRGGDAGWTQPYSVKDGRASDLILGESERMWL